MPLLTPDRNFWLSVIIPVHDGERWLKETLDSVVVQQDEGIECVVIDSSPGDGTLALVNTYSDRLNLKIFKRPDLDNWRTKTNFGFEQASAPYVCMLHQDDYWLPGRAEALRGWISAQPDAAMHLHPSYFVNEDSRRLGMWSCPLPDDGAPVSRDLLLERLLVQNFISVPSPAIRRQTFLDVGGIEEALWYTGDWDLYLKIARDGEVVYHDEALSCFRIHSHSMTVTGSRDASAFESQMRTVMERHMAALSGPARERVRSRALASIEVNTCLAAANNGAAGQLVRAFMALARLGPIGLVQYFRDSRLVERLTPRLRARFSGGL